MNKDNDFVYHERIAPVDSLEKLEGVSLVKFIPLDLNDIASKESDIFSRLIPMQVFEKSSLYSEEKAKLLRSVQSSVEDKNLKLSKFMSAIDLDDLQRESDSNKLPNELIECCASLSARPNLVNELTEKTHGLDFVLVFIILKS